MGFGQYDGQGESTASEVFLTFTSQLYQHLSVFLLFALFNDKPEIFFPKYSQTAILHAAYFQRVENLLYCFCPAGYLWPFDPDVIICVFSVLHFSLQGISVHFTLL